MGAIAKATRRTGYDLGLNQLGGYLKEQRKREERKDFYKKVLDVYNQANAKIKDAGNDDVSTETAKNPFYDPNSLGLGDEGVMSSLNPEMTPTQLEPSTYEKTIRTPVPQAEQYKRAKKVVGDFQTSLLPFLLDPDADQEQLSRVNALGQLVGNQVENLKPLQKKYEEYDPAKGEHEIDPITGERTVVREPQTKPKLFDIEGTFKNSKTKTYWTYDKQTGKPVDTGIEYEKNNDDSGWASLNYRIGKDQQEELEKNDESQAQYNAIMGSPFVKTNELIAQGLIDRGKVSKLRQKYGKDSKGNEGGAYVVRNSNGSPELFFSNEDLESFAKSKISKAPNKWSRKNQKVQSPSNDQDANIKAYAKKWNITEKEARNFLSD
jgi:hypothetical protein